MYIRTSRYEHMVKPVNLPILAQGSRSRHAEECVSFSSTVMVFFFIGRAWKKFVTHETDLLKPFHGKAWPTGTKRHEPLRLNPDFRTRFLPTLYTKDSRSLWCHEAHEGHHSLPTCTPCPSGTCACNRQDRCTTGGSCAICSSCTKHSCQGNA